MTVNNNYEFDQIGFEKQLRQQIEETRVTQKFLADQLAVNRSTLSKWIKTTNRISYADLGKLCAALHLSEPEAQPIFR